MNSVIAFSSTLFRDIRISQHQVIVKLFETRGHQTFFLLRLHWIYTQYEICVSAKIYFHFPFY